MEDNNIEKDNIQVENTQNNIEIQTIESNSIQNEVTQTENVDDQNSEEVKIQNENIETQNVQADNNQIEVTPDSKSEGVNITNQTSNNKSKKIIIIVIGIIILIVAILFVLYFILKDKNSNNSNNNKDNNDDLQNNIGENITSTDSDDGYISSPTDNEEVKDEYELYVYNKSKDFIVFKYKCKNENGFCDLKVIDKKIIIYDDGKVIYRDFTTQEYNKINSDKEEITEELSLEGFKEIESLTDDINFDLGDTSVYLPNLYSINNELYLVDYRDHIIYHKDEFISEEIDNLIITDSFIMSGSCGFDYKNKKKFIFDYTSCGINIEDYKKIGKYYYFLLDGDPYGRGYSLLNEYGEIVLEHISSLYFNDDNIYYIKYNKHTEKYDIKVLDDKAQITSYKLEGTPIEIFGDKLIYEDNDNMLSVKNLLDDEYNYKLNIKLDKYLWYPQGDTITITVNDYSLLDNKEFDAYRKKEGITDKEIEEARKYIKEDYSDWWNYCIIGYDIILDKQGKIVSKNYNIYID